MLRTTAAFLFVACTWMIVSTAAFAQPASFMISEAASDIIDMDKPRVAVGADGSSAVAFDALVDGEFVDGWHVGVQRFSPTGAAVGPIHLFEPESGCTSFDFWTSDYQHDAEIAFRSDGILMVVMQHAGSLEVAGDGWITAELTIGAIGVDGQAIDLNPELSNCEQHKLIFVGGSRQDRARLALLPDNSMLITADGFFQSSDLRNVAIRALGPELEEIIEEVIPHDDPASQQSFHMRPDISTNGNLMLSVWQECPIVDQQGNADDCDIGAQFGSVTPEGLVAVGTNQQVNAGDQAGTLQLYPSSAMNAAGASVIVWADARTGLNGDIFAQRFDAQGQAVGANIQVSVGEGVIDTRPEVAMLDDGSFMVVWTDSTAGAYRARGREFDAGGNALSQPFLLSNQAGVHTGVPHVASSGTEFVYVWGTQQDGSFGIYSNDLGSVVANEPDVAPAALKLDVYPNPFTAESTVRYRLPHPDVVTVSVFDVLGREVARLADGRQLAGVHDVRLSRPDLPAGAYLIRLRAGNQHHTLLLIKTE